jgi:putative sigma-54 modulation protein
MSRWRRRQSISRGTDLFAKAQSSDMYVSIDQLINKLDSQIIKHKEKLHSPQRLV